MERLTAGNYRLFLESYASIYVNETGDLQEQEIIQEFLQVVNELVEEGYDLSEYTYDELYEHYLSEGGLGTILKSIGGRALTAARGAARTAWKGTVKQTKEGPKYIPGGKETTKEILAKTGKVAPLVALAAGADQALTGGAGREWLGRGVQAVKDVGHSIPKPDKSQPTKPKSSSEDEKKKSWDQLQSVDLFDLVKGHLLDEGYAETEEAAIVIMANMSEEWRNSILEQSAIASRTAKVVDDQRQGYHGDSDAINKLQNATSKSIGKLKRGQGPVVTPGLPGV